MTSLQRVAKKMAEARAKKLVLDIKTRSSQWQISYRGGLGTSLCIMGYGTQHPHSRKEHTALYNISKFGVNQANIRKDTAIQKLQILLRNVWNAGRVSGVPYISS